MDSTVNAEIRYVYKDESKGDQFEYRIELPVGLDEWNEKGKNGWEMVTVTKCDDIIWKRKI